MVRTRKYEPTIPITHEELLDVARKISIGDLEREYFRHQGSRYNDRTISLIHSYEINQVWINDSEKSEIPIEIGAQEDYEQRDLKDRLERLLKLDLQEIPQEALV